MINVLKMCHKINSQDYVVLRCMFSHIRLSNETQIRGTKHLPRRKNFFLKGQTLRESNLNISLHVHIHSIDVRNLLRNFNRRHSSRDTIHTPRKHRSRKLYINDLQRAENSGRVFSSFLRRIFVLLFLFHSGSFAPPPFPARFIAHYVGVQFMYPP